MKIEKASLQDAVELSEIIASEFSYTQANPENVRKRMQNPNIALFKLSDNEKILGFIEWELIEPLFGIARINGMAVVESERGKGFGSKLIKFAIEELKNNGVVEVCLLVKPENKIARKLYEKFGFKVKGWAEKKIEGKKVKEMNLFLQEIA